MDSGFSDVTVPLALVERHSRSHQVHKRIGRPRYSFIFLLSVFFSLEIVDGKGWRIELTDREKRIRTCIRVCINEIAHGISFYRNWCCNWSAVIEARPHTVVLSLWRLPRRMHSRRMEGRPGGRYNQFRASLLRRKAKRLRGSARGGGGGGNRGGQRERTLGDSRASPRSLKAQSQAFSINL